eukprot:TRINITY_DN1641_c0_g1_i3.p1 TRINITY_DN1641_c0_g1~~TRINITY_DN1641_c0_g1_i3.p1  ORF type:complete len:537 (-),score=80.92 TRINITY_DN1641_c0_g1_i3:88-1698(-)
MCLQIQAQLYMFDILKALRLLRMIRMQPSVSRVQLHLKVPFAKYKLIISGIIDLLCKNDTNVSTFVYTETVSLDGAIFNIGRSCNNFLNFSLMLNNEYEYLVKSMNINPVLMINSDERSCPDPGPPCLQYPTCPETKVVPSNNKDCLSPSSKSLSVLLVKKTEECPCEEYYTGDDCDIPICTPNCINGECIGNDPAPLCSCFDGWKGQKCNELDCLGTPICSGNGECIQTILPVCNCDEGYGGDNCSLVQCIGYDEENDIKCNGNGICSDHLGYPKCFCDIGYNGDICEEFIGFDCSTCDEGESCNRTTGKCTGSDGYPVEPINNISHCIGEPACNERGQCVNGICDCNEYSMGSDCSIPVCAVCDRGSCIFEGTETYCNCSTGFNGTGCQEVLPSFCPDDCGSNGQCDLDSTIPKCICNSNFWGEGCQNRISGETYTPSSPITIPLVVCTLIVILIAALLMVAYYKKRQYQRRQIMTELRDKVERIKNSPSEEERNTYLPEDITTEDIKSLQEVENVNKSEPTDDLVLILPDPIV